MFSIDVGKLVSNELRVYMSNLSNDRIHLAEDRAFYYCDQVYSNYEEENFKLALAFQREVINNIIPQVNPDLIHCNDWMSSLIPLLIKTTFSESHLFENTKFIDYLNQINPTNPTNPTENKFNTITNSEVRRKLLIRITLETFKMKNEIGKIEEEFKVSKEELQEFIYVKMNENTLILSQNYKESDFSI